MIGRGGMAVVYRALDLKIPRVVAVKVLHRELMAFILRDRFLREVRTIAQLTHPHILPLYDADENGGWLYYVSPFMEEGSLRDRLARAGPLPVAEALELIRQIGGALAAAHAHVPRIVHRDIKPGNILLDGQHAFLADFGIAQVAVDNSSPTSEPITEAGMAIGTVGYMSPEQIRGSLELDGRSDQFALAVVLHEMLVGTPPDLLAQDDPLHRLEADHPEVHAPVVAALRRALATRPNDRFPTITDFLSALAPASIAEPPAARPALIPRSPEPGNAAVTPNRRRLTILLALGFGLLAALAWFAPPVRQALTELIHPRPAIDTTRYAVLPFVYDSGLAPLDERSALRDALGSRWLGITLVEELRESEMLAQHAGSGWTTNEALLSARALGAGRFVRGRVSRVGDSLRVLAGLYDATAGGAQLSFGTARLPIQPGDTRAVFERMADRLLLRDGIPGDSFDTDPGSRSLPAIQAFATGTRALDEWNLPAADSGFARATRHDDDYVRAHLMLGLVRQWEGIEPGRWRSSAERAAVGRARLAPIDQLRADALLASAGNTAEGACGLWREITRRAPTDFQAWYAAGACQVGDSVVVPDRRSPSGWRFRSSYQAGLAAFLRAFRLEPKVLAAYREGSYAALRLLFVTDPHQFRSGRAGGTGFRLTAFPEWQADSLGFVPESAGVTLPPSRRAPAAIAMVAARQRRLLLDTVEEWTSAEPLDPRALEALAVAQDLLGRRDATTTLDRAARLTRDRGDRLRVGRSVVWLGLKYALPDDPRELARLARLADSLLQSEPPTGSGDPVSMAGLASLIGRPRLAADYLTQPAALQQWGVPPELGAAAIRLLIYAAAAAPADTVSALAREVRRRLERILDPALRSRETGEWLVRAATLAFPAGVDLDIQSLAGLGDPLLDAQAALVRADSTGARKLLGRLGAMRAGLQLSELTLDGLYPEASLRLALGDSRHAAEVLDSVLGSASAMDTDLLADPIRVASLRQAMVFRTRLAVATGDSTTARRWGGVLQALRSGAEPERFTIPEEMEPTVRPSRN